MIMAVISPLPLAVDEEDFMLIATVPQGKDQGKHAYINTRFTKEHCDVLFSKTNYDNALALIQGEVLKSENLFESLACWYEATCIMTLSVEEVSVFSEFCQLAKDPEMISLITADEYDKGVSVARMLLVNGMDLLMNMYRRNPGGNE